MLLAEAADVDAAVQAAKTAFETWSDDVGRRAARGSCSRSASWSSQHTDELARIISAEHGKTFEDAKGEVIRGMEVVEFACGIAELTKGEFSDQVSTDVDLHSLPAAARACARGSRRSTSRSWSRCGCTRWRSRPGTRSCSSRPSAIRRVSNLIAELYAEAGLPDGVFNVVHGDKVAVDALLDHPDVAAISFVGSTPIAKYIHERATATGKRVQALGGAKNHAIVMPDADLDFAANQLTAAGYGSRRPALHGDLRRGRGRRRRRRADREAAREGAGREGRPGARSRLRDGAAGHRRGARPGRRLHRPRRGRRRRRRPRARDRGRRLLGRPDADRQRHAPT